LSRQAVHKQLNKLQEQHSVRKIGRPPRVYYLLQETLDVDDNRAISPETQRVIDDNFINITSSGELQEGMQGFITWADKRGEPLQKTAEEYVATLAKYNRYKRNGLINGMHKLKETFPKIYLDKVFYLDFYSIERFGKTRLGQLLLYAKQSQDSRLIRELSEQSKPAILELIERYSVDAVGFIPPTVKREIQLMKELKKQLNLPASTISLVKVKTDILVPQKTLNKLNDRIENAAATIMVDGKKQFETVLLIDDAVGSGSTLNETARKIKKQGVAKNVIGLAITGSFSGFEIISEV
jgi:phosphoribosylpyrophosphate synthetase